MIVHIEAEGVTFTRLEGYCEETTSTFLVIACSFVWYGLGSGIYQLYYFKQRSQAFKTNNRRICDRVWATV